MVMMECPSSWCSSKRPAGQFQAVHIVFIAPLSSVSLNKMLSFNHVFRCSFYQFLYITVCNSYCKAVQVTFRSCMPLCPIYLFQMGHYCSLQLNLSRIQLAPGYFDLQWGEIFSVNKYLSQGFVKGRMVFVCFHLMNFYKEIFLSDKMHNMVLEIRPPKETSENFSLVLCFLRLTFLYTFAA